METKVKANLGKHQIPAVVVRSRIDMSINNWMNDKCGESFERCSEERRRTVTKLVTDEIRKNTLSILSKEKISEVKTLIISARKLAQILETCLPNQVSSLYPEVDEKEFIRIMQIQMESR